jgi:hypothetical protein
MLRLSIFVAGLLVLVNAHGGTDFNCMQGCFAQGYDRPYCASICSSRGVPSGGGMMDQPGLPKNPALDEMRRDANRRAPVPRVTEPNCLKNCRGRGYNYTYCQQQCSYSSPYDR